MSCEECRDQVLELLEREAEDPEGVREILSRCPDCRAEFESLKTALSEVEAMPLALPSSSVDREVLAVARARLPAASGDGVARPPGEPTGPASRRRQPLPWAIAATALLAVGIGVATSSRWLPPGAAPPSASNFETTSDSRAGLDDSRSDAEREASAPAAPPFEARSEGADVAEIELRKASSAGRLNADATAKHKAQVRRQERPAAPSRDRPVDFAQESKAGARSGQPRSAAFEAKDAAAPMATAAREYALGTHVAESVAESDRDARAIEVCRQGIGAFERRLREDPERKVRAEEQLRAGVCYRDLRRLDEARFWLERATRDPKTRQRAEEALRTLPSALPGD